MNNSVVVTGVGIVAPLRSLKGVDEFWNALCSGEDAIKKMPPPLLRIDREWPMAVIDLSDYKRSVNLEDKLQVIAEEALSSAIKDANIQGIQNIGLSIGTVLGNVLCKEKRLIESKIQDKNDTEKNGNRESLSFVVSHLAKKYNLNGPNITISTACASGTDAIGVAVRRIQAGKAKIIIAGGVDVLSDFALLGFHALQALTEDKVRPFDKKRSGLALGEGAAFIVLESGKHALKREARIYARVMGYASRADANHLTGPHREGRGLSDAINQAIFEANVKPQEVNYINAHGTGTVYNDLMETKAIKNAFGKIAYSIPVSSIKSMLGHSFGAAGVIEAICCLLSIKNKTIPPTINFEEGDSECDLDYVPNISRQHDVNIAMSLSAGFGGQNSVLLLGEA